jgi:hypothetical protein
LFLLGFFRNAERPGGGNVMLKYVKVLSNNLTVLVTVTGFVLSGP